MALSPISSAVQLFRESVKSLIQSDPGLCTDFAILSDPMDISDAWESCQKRRITDSFLFALRDRLKLLNSPKPKDLSLKISKAPPKVIAKKIVRFSPKSTEKAQQEQKERSELSFEATFEALNNDHASREEFLRSETVDDCWDAWRNFCKRHIDGLFLMNVRDKIMEPKPISEVHKVKKLYKEKI